MTLKNILALLMAGLLCWSFQAGAQENEEQEVNDISSFNPQLKVTAPFVELRIGPASGYPIFHVSEKGEWLEVVRRKTDWLKVRDAEGLEGWLNIDDIPQMSDSSGQQVTVIEPLLGDVSTRRWEAGVMGGEFDKAPVNSAYVGFWMTNNLSIELWGSQVLGDSAEIKIANLNILHQPFPEWFISPYVTLGAGKVFINPKATLSDVAKRDEDTVHVGLGARYFLSNRYFVRMEMKDYKIFTNRERNEEAREWKIGLGVFF